MRRINRAEYKQIKDRLDYGESAVDVMADTDRSPQVVYAIKRSRNFADYKRIGSAGYKTEAAEVQPTRRKSSKRMTPEKYTQIKGLLDIGVTGAHIAHLLNISTSTVSRIRHTADWAAYQAILDQMNTDRLAREARLEPPKPEAIPTGSPGSYSELTELLTDNTQALQDLAKAWNNLSEKLDEVIETKRPWMSKIKG